MLTMSHHLIASAVIFFVGILFAYKNKLKCDSIDLIALLFLFVFNLSLLTSSVPYGFKEFSTFNAGILLFFAARNSQFSIFNSQLLIITYYLLLTFILFGFFDLLSSPVDRLASFFKGDEPYTNYPNAAADLLLFFITPLLGLALYKKKNFKYCILVILAMCAFWLTLSRGAFLAFAVSLGAMFAYELIAEKNLKQLFKNSLKICSLIFLSGFLAFGIYQFDTDHLDISERLTSTDISANKSLNERAMLFNGAIQIIKDNPFLGVGPGGFSDHNPRYQTVPLVNSEHPHNVFLKLASESGVFTAIIFAVFLFFAYLKAIQNLSSFDQKLDRTKFFTIFAASLGVLFHQLVDYNFNFTIIYILFFASLGYLTSYKFSLSLHKNYTYFSYAILIIATVFLTVSLLQFRGYALLKFYTPLYQSESNTLKTSQTQTLLNLTSFWQLPFKHHYFEVLNSNPKNIAPFTDYLRTANYTHYPLYLAQYYTADTESDKIEHLNNALSQNPLNNLSLHKLYLQTNQPINLQNYIQLLSDYNALLSVNAHNMIATLNKNTVLAIYDMLENRYKNDTKELQHLRQEFLRLYDIELAKFNSRFYQ